MTNLDEFEVWFEKGVTDGLPVVPPTRERVERMLAGTGRARDELLGEMPPNYGRLTVEKAAINAVLAGCRPEYLPVVVAAAECACDPEFNLHGMSTSTHFSAPLILANGPIREHIGLNRGFGVFGPGYRANATIGRALRPLMINVGGARPAETSMSTFGHPGRYTYWRASGTASTSRCTPTRCWSWARNTPGRSPTAGGRRMISSDISTRPCGGPSTRSCPTRTMAKARTCASAKAKLGASPTL